MFWVWYSIYQGEELRALPRYLPKMSTPYALPVKNKESLTGKLPPFLNVVDPSEPKIDSRSAESASTRIPPGFHPVQIHFGSRFLDWMLCQLFPLDSLCNSVGCGTLPHSP